MMRRLAAATMLARKPSRRALFSLLAVPFFSFLAPLAPAAQATEVVNYGYIAPTAYYWDVFAASALGFDKREGIEIRPLRIGSASQSIQTLLSGSIDFLSTPTELAISAREKGGDVTILGGETARASFALVARPEIHQYSDLRGKIIGVTQVNEAVSTMVTLLLEKHGLKPGDYQMLALGGGPNRYAALTRGAIAATALSQPQDFRAAADGLKTLGYTYEAFEGAYIVIATRGEWAAQHPELTVKFLKAVVSGSRWLHDPANRARAIAILQAAINASEADATKSYDMYYGPTAVMATDLRLPDQDIQRYLTIRGSHDAPGRYIDRSYLKRALDALDASR